MYSIANVWPTPRVVTKWGRVAYIQVRAVVNDFKATSSQGFSID